MSLKLHDCAPDSPVHIVSWAGQPDLYIPCARLWTTPFYYERLPPLPANIHRAESPDDVARVWGFYTFEGALVTCPECLRLMAAGQTRPEGM